MIVQSGTAPSDIIYFSPMILSKLHINPQANPCVIKPILWSAMFSILSMV